MASSSSPLQRGKACIRCRRRKIKCDSARPVCTPCIEANRSEDCEYTDNQGRTRTQILEENVSRLEARLQELENPDISAQTVLLNNPYDANTSAAHIAGHLAQAPIPAPVPAVMSWWEFEEPPAQVIDMLVALFLPHATVFGFALSPERFTRALRLPMLHPARPHPALLHAVFLWGLRLSNVPDLMQHEGLYLQRTILALQDALGGGGSISERPAVAQRRVHAVQASLLLAQYFFTLGRLLEGRYHANAAVALAVSCRMHRITSATLSSTAADQTLAQPGGLFQGANLLELAPARDSVEFGERVRVFWAAYSIDRCWSVALNAPCTLTDDASSGTQIVTPWPRELRQYEQITNLPLASASDLRNGTVHHFVFGHPAQAHNDRENSYAALRARGSALYERASSLSRSVEIEGIQRVPETLRAEIEALAHTTAQFANELTPLDRLDAGARITEARQSLMVVHSLAHAAMTQLHAVTSATPEGELGVSAASLEHAREISMILELATNGEAVIDAQPGAAAVSPVLDPILSIVGMSAARIFLQEYHRMTRGPYTHISRGQMESYRTSVGQIIGALRRAAGAANNYPIFSQQASKIEELLDD